eukprot:12354169-Alexandrium_andersonii.AAC.1
MEQLGLHACLARRDVPPRRAAIRQSSAVMPSSSPRASHATMTAAKARPSALKVICGCGAREGAARARPVRSRPHATSFAEDRVGRDRAHRVREALLEAAGPSVGACHPQVGGLQRHDHCPPFFAAVQIHVRPRRRGYGVNSQRKGGPPGGARSIRGRRPSTHRDGGTRHRGGAVSYTHLRAHETSAHL